MLRSTTVGGRGNTNLTPYKFGRQTVNEAKSHVMNVVDDRDSFVCQTAMALLLWNFWPNKKNSSTMNLGRWSCKPPRLGFVQFSSSIWATQESHTQIYTTQQCAGLYLGKCLLKEDMRKTATDQITWCLQCAAIQTQSQLHMAALYNNRPLWTPLSRSSTSAIRRGRQ